MTQHTPQTREEKAAYLDRLIAQAPAMLALLRDIANVNGNIDRVDVANIRAILRAVEGETK